MHALGVRGIRLNTVSVGTPPPDKLRSVLKRAAAQCARQGWHLQIFALPAIIEAMAPTLSHLPVPIVFDHFGMVRPERIESQAVRSRHQGTRPPFRGRQSGAGRLGQRLAAHAAASRPSRGRSSGGSVSGHRYQRAPLPAARLVRAAPIATDPGRQSGAALWLRLAHGLAAATSRSLAITSAPTSFSPYSFQTGATASIHLARCAGVMAMISSRVTNGRCFG